MTAHPTNPFNCDASNIAEILTKRFASGSPGEPLTLTLHESHMLIARLNPPRENHDATSSSPSFNAEDVRGSGEAVHDLTRSTSAGGGSDVGGDVGIELHKGGTGSAGRLSLSERSHAAPSGEESQQLAAQPSAAPKEALDELQGPAGGARTDAVEKSVQSTGTFTPGACRDGSSPHYCPNCDNTFYAASSSAETPAGQTEWQDIATAPQDGMMFIGGYQHKTYGWVWDRCRFYDEDKHGVRSPYVVMEGGGKPTHWMPVVAPSPASSAERTEP